MQKSNRKKPAFGLCGSITLGELRDERKFDDFVRQSYERLLGFAYQLLGNWDDAEDVVQTVFMELWELVTKRLKEPNANAIAVTYQLVKRRTSDLRIKQPSSFNPEWLEEPFSEEAFDDGLSWEEEMKDVEGIVIAIEKRRAIHECGNQLQGRAREVFSLFLQGVPNAEIAKNLGISAARVSQLMKIVFIQLKQKLQEMGYDCNETVNVPLKF